MNVLTVVIATIAILIMGAICLMAIVENTRVLNEEKALRRELADIQRLSDAMPINPSDAELTVLNTRLDAYRVRHNKFMASPFVITRRA